MRLSISIILPIIASCTIGEARFADCRGTGVICTADEWRGLVGNDYARCCGPIGSATGIYRDYLTSTIQVNKCPSGYICTETGTSPLRAICQRVLKDGSNDPVLCSLYALVCPVIESSDDSSDDCVIPLPGT